MLRNHLILPFKTFDLADGVIRKPPRTYYIADAGLPESLVIGLDKPFDAFLDGFFTFAEGDLCPLKYSDCIQPMHIAMK